MKLARFRVNDRVKLLPPTCPTSFWAVGLNYAVHVAHQEVALDTERIRRESAGFRHCTKPPPVSDISDSTLDCMISL